MCVRDHFSSIMGPYGTIGQWSFFSWLLKRTCPGPKAKHLKRHTRTRKWAAAPKKPWYSLNNFSTINSSLKNSWLCVFLTICRCVFVSFLCVVLWEALEMGPGEQKWASESIIYVFLSWSMGEWGQCSRFFWVHVLHSTVDIDRRPIFFGMRAHRQSISTNFFCMHPHRRSKSTVDAISTVFSGRWILIDRRYQPYSQIGESLSTVDIDRILTHMNPYRPSISNVTDRPVD